MRMARWLGLAAACTPTGSPPPCEAVPGLAVAEVSVSQPWHANELLVEVALTAPATVAVACTRDADPEEVHLVQDPDASVHHALRLSGLLADEPYTCHAAAVCPWSGAPPTRFAVRTPPLAGRLPDVVAETLDPGAGSEYVLINHSLMCEGSGLGDRLMVFDRDGGIRWWTRIPDGVGPSLEFTHQGGNRFAWGGGWSPNSGGRPRLIDLFDGEIYDSGPALPDLDVSRFHHDGKVLPDGRLLTLEEGPVSTADGTFRGFRVRRIDPVTQTVDFDYSSQRAYDEGHLPLGTGDPWHANWADITTLQGQEVLLVSLCHVGRVVAVDVATGAWRWSLGDGLDFALVDAAGQPLPEAEFPQCQHGLQSSGDRLLVYDNGVFGRGHSRASEYRLDEASMTATLSWTWTEPEWYENALGSVDWMPDGRVLIGMGHPECAAPIRGDHSTVVQIDPVTGTKLWQAALARPNDMLYRADWAGPCALFANGKYCGDVTERYDALGAVLK